MTAFLLLLALTLATAPAAGERPYPLMAGDPAPALPVQTWNKGEPVERFEPGTVYVIDFWSTWCGPCKAAMPALSELQRRHRDRAVFIGVDTWDYADRVGPFVAAMGDSLDYRVATDRHPAPAADEDNVPMYVKENGECSRAWLRASGFADEGIPTLFVVDGQGRVAWIGQTVEELEQVLPQVVAGSWDLAGYAARYAADAVVLRRGRALESDAFRARRRKDWRTAIGHLRALVELDPRYHSRAGVAFRVTWADSGDHAAALAYADAQLKVNRSPEALEEMAQTIAKAESPSRAGRAARERLVRRARELRETASAR